MIPGMQDIRFWLTQACITALFLLLSYSYIV